MFAGHSNLNRQAKTDSNRLLFRFPLFIPITSRYLLVAIFLLAGVFNNHAANRSYLYQPESYVVPSKDGKYIFVMLAPKTADNALDNLQRIYPASGLYFNNGATNPLWKVNRFSQQIAVSRDGKHVAAFGPWPHDTFHASILKVSFYENGKEIKHYHDSDLMDLKTYTNAWNETWEFDDTRNLLKIEMASPLQTTLPPSELNVKFGVTNAGPTWMFDISTGRILSQIPPVVYDPIIQQTTIFPAGSIELHVRRLEGKQTVLINEVEIKPNEQKVIKSKNGNVQYPIHVELIGTGSVVVTIHFSKDNQKTKVLELNRSEIINP